MPLAETVACPFCNAFVPVPLDAASGRRLTCPRCLEAFAYLPRDGVTAVPPVDHAATSSPSAITSERPAPSSTETDSLQAKAQILFRALLVMAGVLLFVGGVYINSLVSNGITVDFGMFAGVAVPLLMLLIAVGAAGFLWLWFFRVRRSNAATSLFVLGNMVTLALLALGGALATQGYRRHIDAGLPARPRRSPITEEIVPAGPVVVAPAHLAALGYLPPKIDLVAGVHVAELWDRPTERKLLNEPLKLGNDEVRLADLAGKIGLDPGDLDHFVVGMRLDEPLSVIFVFRTRQPYDAERVRHALKAKSIPGKSGERTIYQVLFPTDSVSSLLWCADDRTLLVGLAHESLEKAVVPGENSPDPLVPEVRAVLSERIRPVGQLWIVGHAADWSKTAAALLLGRMPEGWQRQLVAIRTFGIWAVIADKTVTLNAAARCDNEKAVERLEKWLASRGSDKRAPTLAPDGNWLSLQLRTDTDSFRGLLAP
jgi:hypothetical protein